MTTGRKAALRRERIAARDALPAAQRDAASAAIRTHLQHHLVDVEQLAAFSPIRNEVDLRPLLEQQLQRGGAVAFPRVTGDTLVFATVEAIADLRPGKFGVAEPSGNAIDLGSLDVVLVPGVAFDRDGRRIGFGGGYYDRALAEISRRNPHAIFIGVAFELQIVDDIEAQAWDIPMHRLVTERALWNTPAHPLR